MNNLLNLQFRLSDVASSYDVESMIRLSYWRRKLVLLLPGIRLLLDDANGVFTFQKIVQIIGKAPSTVSVQLGRLIDHKLVIFDEKCGYTVNNKQTIKRLISKYKV